MSLTHLNAQQEDYNTSPPSERRPSRLRPICTIKPGEMVTVGLRGKQLDTLNAWAGRVVAVDGVALRLSVTLRRVDWNWQMADGEQVIPWSRVDHVQIWGGL